MRSDHAREDLEPTQIDQGESQVKDDNATSKPATQHLLNPHPDLGSATDQQIKDMISEGCPNAQGY